MTSLFVAQRKFSPAWVPWVGWGGYAYMLGMMLLLNGCNVWFLLKGLSHEMDLAFDDPHAVLDLHRGRDQFLNLLSAPLIL
jgi:hypothetical protein